MWLNENLIKFIESSGKIAKTSIYISDLRKIKLCYFPNKEAKKMDKLISREMLESLLIIGTAIEQDKYIITNSKKSIIPLFDDKTGDENFSSQIILPLWSDNELKGSLILVTENRKFDEYDLELARCMQLFIEESIVDSINEDFFKKTEKKKTKSIIKKEPTEGSDESNNSLINVSDEENDM